MSASCCKRELKIHAWSWLFVDNSICSISELDALIADAKREHVIKFKRTSLQSLDCAWLEAWQRKRRIASGTDWQKTLLLLDALAAFPPGRELKSVVRGNAMVMRERRAAFRACSLLSLFIAAGVVKKIPIVRAADVARFVSTTWNPFHEINFL